MSGVLVKERRLGLVELWLGRNVMVKKRESGESSREGIVTNVMQRNSVRSIDGRPVNGRNQILAVTITFGGENNTENIEITAENWNDFCITKGPFRSTS